MTRPRRADIDSYLGALAVLGLALVALAYALTAVLMVDAITGNW
jgi:hypothetical protein